MKAIERRRNEISLYYADMCRLLLHSLFYWSLLSSGMVDTVTDVLGWNGLSSIFTLRKEGKLMTDLPNGKETRIIHLAYQFAMVHISDGDVLGKMARELHALVDELHPEVKEMEFDGDE